MAEIDPYGDEYAGVVTFLRRSAVARAAGLLVVGLALQVPIEMIGSTVRERESYREAAVRAVSETWGGHQIVRGPFLVVPFRPRPGAAGEAPEVQRNSFTLPESLGIDGELITEMRRRGIFDVPLYVGHFGLSGSLRIPDSSAFPNNADIQWDKATLVVAVSDPKALRADALLTWGAAQVPMQPGAGIELYPSGIHTLLPLTEGDAGKVVSFALDLQLAGSGGLWLIPAGSETTVRLRSNAPDPSFVGAYPPAARTVNGDGFEATWRIPKLARSFPAAWNCGDVQASAIDDSLFGVTLFPTVDAYRSTDRALKYDLLFIGLTFLAFFAFEQTYGRRVSVVQYLLVGLALCLFYLLLLSLAEHLGFAPAYAIAAAAITAMITAYSRAVLDSRARMATIGALVGSLYAYLYVLLQLEDFALLAGSLGLFAVLGVGMYLTRKVNARSFSPQTAVV